MTLWPRYTLEIETPCSAAETIERLRARVEPYRWFRWPWDHHQPFAGEVAAASFRLRRIVSYQNDGQPAIVGKVRPSGGGCVVSIEMRPTGRAAAVIGAMASFVSVLLVVFLNGWLRGRQSPFGVLVGAAMLLYIMSFYGAMFWLEARKVRRILRDLLA